MAEELIFTVEEDVARIVFNRPQARNALTFAMYDRLTEICGTIKDRPEIKAVLLTGAGDRAFAAGTDITEFAKLVSAEDALGYERMIERALSALEECHVPTVAAIAGACTGGGLALALACDLRLATADAQFGLPLARTLGNCLSLANYARLCAIIGPARVKDMLFTARLLTAGEARDIGLVTEVVAEAMTLAERGTALLRLLASHAPLTLRATKEALRRLRPPVAAGDGDDFILDCYLSDDFREGRAAFLEKRPAHWQGK